MKEQHPRNVRLLIAIASSGRPAYAIAQAAGISPLTLSQLVRQRRAPKPETVRALCRVLRSTPRKLGLGGDDR